MLHINHTLDIYPHALVWLIVFQNLIFMQLGYQSNKVNMTLYYLNLPAFIGKTFMYTTLLSSLEENMHYHV
jgi:hypothetical protein